MATQLMALYKIPSFSIEQTDTPNFPNRQTQYAWFDSLTHIEIAKNHFKQTGTTSIKVEKPISELRGYNYGFIIDNKTNPVRTFFFILNSYYVNEGTSKVIISFDWWQTYLPDVTWKLCDIQREHPDATHAMSHNDLKVRNEDFDLPFKYTNLNTNSLFAPNYALVCFKFQPHNYNPEEQYVYVNYSVKGITHTCMVAGFDLNNSNQSKAFSYLLSKAYSQGKTDDILWVQRVSRWFLNQNMIENRGYGESEIEAPEPFWNTLSNVHAYDHPELQGGLEFSALRYWEYVDSNTGVQNFYRSEYLGANDFSLSTSGDAILDTYKNIQLKFNNNIFANVPVNDNDILDILKGGTFNIKVTCNAFEKAPKMLFWLVNSRTNETRSKLIAEINGYIDLTIFNNALATYWEHEGTSMIVNALANVAQGASYGYMVTGTPIGAGIGAVSGVGSSILSGMANAEQARAISNRESVASTVGLDAMVHASQVKQYVDSGASSAQAEYYARKSGKALASLKASLNQAEEDVEWTTKLADNLRTTGSSGILEHAINIASTCVEKSKLPDYFQCQSSTTNELITLVGKDDFKISVGFIKPSDTDLSSISEFYKMFGYGYHVLQVPNLFLYNGFSYFKMDSCNFLLEANTSIISYIKNMFSRGVRVWNNKDAFLALNYDCENNRVI